MEEKSELRRMPFGKKLKCGNFTVLKYVKAPSKHALAELRREAGIDERMRRHLHRGTLPYIKVEAISGMWSVEFCCNTQMYMLIDQYLNESIERAKANEKSEPSVADFAHLFAMMCSDTLFIGDAEYRKAKAVAMQSFMDRVKAGDVSDEEDREIVESLKKDDETAAAIVEMGKEVLDEGE